MPTQTTELRVRDVRIKLHRAGNGPTVLFLHGAVRFGTQATHLLHFCLKRRIRAS